ncbi:MAG: cyanoglobin [Bacteroidales bacterium]|nr:cyanoglobin [Bacteroidales bacterium]
MQLSYYERIGNEKLQNLISFFYDEIRQDEVLLPMYKGDLEAAERRLFMFIVQYLGGPQTYSERRGHPRLRMRHAEFKVDNEAAEHWLACMKKAMDKIEMEEDIRRFLWSYFVQTAHFLENQ